MELVLKSRGVRVTEHLRRAVERKLAKVSRLEPRAVRLELELISERNPRLHHAKRLEASLEGPRHTFRARSQGPDFNVALDELVEHLERQIRDHRGRKRK